MRIVFSALFLIATALSAAPSPAPVENKPVGVETNPKKVMLMKLIEAGILMLEGGAYQQFIQAFVGDEDRRRFEQAYSKNGPVNYEQWGRDKGEAMLRVLKQLQGKEPVWFGEKACFANDNLPKKNFSFAFTRGAWFIENHSNCPTIEIKKAAEPATVPPSSR